jgi:23S rRNA pseudouridine955/2504/2580 synthase
VNPVATAVQVQQLTVDERGEGQRLDNFLLRHLKGVPKTHVYRVIRSGEVRVNARRAQPDTRVEMGDVVRVPPVRMGAPKVEAGEPGDDDRSTSAGHAPAREFAILHEDDHLLAIDKPAGVAVHGGSGVAFGVIEQLRRARPTARMLELVHRLDKETSGVLLVAKKRSALTALQDQFRARGTDKVYAALVGGEWPESRKVIDVPLLKTLDADGERVVRPVPRSAAPAARATAARGAHADRAASPEAKRSITLVTVAQRLPGFTMLDVVIRTGRTHQIRVHLAHEGHPIVGDPKYGDFELNRHVRREPWRWHRMFLHARSIAFDHPASGERLVLQSALPHACEVFLRALNDRPA